MPQPPQFDLFVAVSTQLPLQTLPPHEALHMPTEQYWLAGQAAPQAPQLAGSTFVSTHVVPHCVVPLPHATVHTLFEQTWPAPQVVPQIPQF